MDGVSLFRLVVPVNQSLGRLLMPGLLKDGQANSYIASLTRNGAKKMGLAHAIYGISFLFPFAGNSRDLD